MAEKCSDCKHFEFIMDFVCERVGYCLNKGNTVLYDPDGKRKEESDMRAMLDLENVKEEAVVLEKHHCPFFETAEK